MIAVRTPFTRADRPVFRPEIRQAIEGQIPLPAGRYNASVKKTARPRVEQLAARAAALRRLADYHTRAARQLMEKWFIRLPDPNLACLVRGRRGV